ncbi:ATP-dependent DNA helicase RecQ [Jejuia pallidilutea]|uniref:ATP-dependent DNA helicase RecQ n=1 Tax=Jejuia pallidilutea TaxID=504487 RepID=A0A090WJE7_9FLAO|nr:ATP-dependent DNA helicase RecQ [Jejuia pallidilutea]
MSIAKVDLHDALKKYFGFNKFKGLQEGVVKSILEGNHTFVIMLLEVVNRFVTNYQL